MKTSPFRQPLVLRTAAYLWIVCAALDTGSTAHAHARLKETGVIKPRSSADGLKSAPCGGVAPTAPTAVEAGETIRVEFEETINHPGWYELNLSNDGGQTFQHKLVERLDDMQNDRNTLPHQYAVDITIPELLCTDTCVIQLIQVMTDRNPPTNYYSCADINILPAGQSTADTASPTQDATETLPARSKPPEGFTVKRTRLPEVGP